MTKEKLAKLRGMGLVFDDAFDELAELKEKRSIANDLTIVLEGNPEPPPNLNQLYYHTYFNKDGAILIQKYLKDGLGNTKGSFNDKLTDINIYYEDGSTDDAFGTVCYVCMNKNLRDKMHDKEFHLSSAWLCDDIILNYETLRYKPENYVTVDRDILLDAIDYELNHSGGAAGFLSQLIIKLCKSLSGWIRESLYSEINWNPNLNNYDPIFGPPQYKQFGKDWQAFKVKSNHFFSKAKYIGTLCSHIDIVGGLLQGIINFVINIFKTIIDVIDNIVKELVKFFDVVANINAFVCGLLNGVTEFVASLFDFIALLITLTDKAERQLIKESLENLYAEFKKHPVEKITEILTQAFESLKDRYSKKEDYEKAYNAGEDLVSVILIVDGVVAVVKILKSIPKGFERLVGWAEKRALKLNALVKTAEELSKFVIKNGIKLDIKSIEFVIEMVKGNRALVESILLSTKEVIEGKTIEQLVAIFKIIDPPKIGSLSNYQARIWYTLKKQKIGVLIERESSLLAKAKRAFELRNEYRAATRKFMKDRKLAEYLEKFEENQKWDEYLRYISNLPETNGIDDAYKIIIEKAKSGRDKVDRLFKIQK